MQRRAYKKSSYKYNNELPQWRKIFNSKFKFNNNQNYKNWELIFYNNFSFDKSKNIIKKI